jgi:excisionase family DNA binding protein
MDTEMHRMNAYLSIREICEQTRFSRPFVAREMKRGNLKFGRIGRRVRVSHYWFQRWMEGRPVDNLPAPTETPPAAPDPMAKLQSRVDEIAIVLTGIADRMEERTMALDAIGSNLAALLEEVRARR